MEWDEFSRDLRLAWYWTDHLYVFSLEGCVRQGFLERLKEFDWDYPIFFPEDQAEAIHRWRSALQSILWLSRHLHTMVIGAVTTLWLVKKLRQGLND